MSRSQPRHRGSFGAGAVTVVVLGVLFLLALPFLPLLFSLLEHLAFGTNYVEEGCRQIGIHGILDDLYESVLPFI